MKFIKKYHKHPEVITIITTLVIIFIYGQYEWNKAGEFSVYLWDYEYENLELMWFKTNHFYQLAFMRIMMFGGFIFGGLLLFLNTKNIKK